MYWDNNLGNPKVKEMKAVLRQNVAFQLPRESKWEETLNQKQFLSIR